MKITVKSRYALRFMLELARINSTTNVKLADVSESQGLSLKYLENIVMTLRIAGYIKSIRGKKGGYRLAVNPDSCTVRMILRLFDSNLDFSSCDDCETKTDDCDGSCSIIQLRKKVDESIDDVIEHTTLANLLEWEQTGGGYGEYI